jgi:hypothetical protein
MPMTRIIYYNISTRFIPRGSAKPVVNFTESRTRLSDFTKLHRKSGSVLGYSQPSLRD